MRSRFAVMAVGAALACPPARARTIVVADETRATYRISTANAVPWVDLADLDGDGRDDVIVTARGPGGADRRIRQAPSAHRGS